MPSGPAERGAGPSGPPVTILCGDLGPSPANASAIALGLWLGDAPRHRPVDVVTLWPGTWAGALAAAGPVWTVNNMAGPDLTPPDHILDLAQHGDRPPTRPLPADMAARGLAGGLHRLGLTRAADVARGWALRRRLAAHDGPVWLAGAAGARLLHYLPPGRRVVAHQGAFDPPIDQVVDDAGDLAVLRRRVDAWVAGSALAEAAVRDAGITAPVTVVPDLVHTRATVGDRAATRRRLADGGIPADATLVASWGEFDWWDAPDLFVQVAWDVVRRGPADVHLLWIAGRATDRMLWPLRHDITHAGLTGRVHVTAPDVRPVDALAAADVVAVTRRGVVSPAQIREIETLGGPVVRFAQPDEPTGRAGGTSVVPFLDDRAMADEVLAVLADPALRTAVRATEVDLPARVAAVLDDRP